MTSLPALQNDCFAAPISMQPGSLIGVLGVMIPWLSAASAVIGLNVEPVGYRPPIARLNRGEPAFGPNSCSRRFWVIGRERTAGSNVGFEPIARTSPLRGSSATNAPAVPGPVAIVLSRTASPVRWRSRSSDVRRARPGTGSRSCGVPFGRPSASTVIRWAPSTPRR